MSLKLTRAVLAAVALTGFSAAGPATAGDLYDRHPRTGSAYDDPRYADIYGDTPRPRYAAPHRYEEPRDYRREPDEYLRPMPGVRRFHDRGACVDRLEARDRLIEQGWRDFQDLELRDDVAVITARRRSGQAYRLKLDRCTGEILSARAVDAYHGPYADRRNGRYY